MKNIAVTGYYGTGSSAVIDLLMGYENVGISVKKGYEHFVFMNKSALFDLASRLYSSNSNYLIRDIAINDFIDEMDRQTNNDFGWYGSYKYLYGDKFKNSVDEFINAISYEDSKDQFAHSKGVTYSPIKAFLQLGAKILKGYKVEKWGRVYQHDNQSSRYLTATEEEFNVAAQKFVNSYLNMSKSDKEYTVYDHLIFPEQYEVVDKYFDKDFKVIIVDRDPRDIFFSGKYVWSTVKFGMQKMPFSNEVEIFCKQWNLIHKKIKESKNIMLIQFEDLVYNFDETRKKILEFIDIDRDSKSVDLFDPKKSIHNTQVYNLFEEHEKERHYIEQQLKEYCYNFPYEVDNNKDLIFDN